MKTLLVINSGSSSVKFELFDMSIPRSLAEGVVEPPGRCPAIGPAEDRRVAVRLSHAVQLGGSDVQRFVPGQRDEPVDPASASLTPFQPAAPN